MRNMHIGFGSAAIALLMACGGGDDDDIESTTEQLRPGASPACITSDDCLYGYCSTEDGECRRASCPPGAGTCAAVCYGACVAAAPPE